MKDHLAKASYRDAKMREDRDRSCVRGGGAVPKNQDQREMIGGINNALPDLEIEVFWVHEDKRVNVGGNW